MLLVYLDNCCYNRPFDSQQQFSVKNETNAKLFIQQLLRLKSLRLCSSFVLVDEITADNDEIKINSILDFIANCSDGVYVSEKELVIIKEKSEQIVSTGVKDMDAVHVACAIFAHCDYFITVDKRLLKYRSDDIKMLNPIEFVKLWGDNGNV
jgi:predicted nucleic acid-binding protein